MPDVVEPSPLVAERLQALAAEHEPTIRAFEDAIAAADPDLVKALRRKLKRARSTYARARRRVVTLRGPAVSW